MLHSKFSTSDHGNAVYKVVRETLYNRSMNTVGGIVILRKNGKQIVDSIAPKGVESITSYSVVESESTFSDVDYAYDCFYNESKLIQNM